MDEEIRFVVLELRLEITIGMDPLETDLHHQLAGVVLPEWVHVEMESGAILEVVGEAGQSVVDMLRLDADVIAAIVVDVLARVAVVQDGVVVALVEDQEAVVIENGVKLSQGLAPILFLEQVGEGVAETDDGIEGLVDIAVEETPVRLHRAQEVSSVTGVVESLAQHHCVAVGTDDVEASLEQPY